MAAKVKNKTRNSRRPKAAERKAVDSHASAKQKKKKRGGTSEEEKALVMEKLRALGYM